MPTKKWLQKKISIYKAFQVLIWYSQWKFQVDLLQRTKWNSFFNRSKWGLSWEIKNKPFIWDEKMWKIGPSSSKGILNFVVTTGMDEDVSSESIAEKPGK